jgi:hypothetical protein
LDSGEAKLSETVAKNRGFAKTETVRNRLETARNRTETATMVSVLAQSETVF